MAAEARLSMPMPPTATPHSHIRLLESCRFSSPLKLHFTKFAYYAVGPFAASVYKSNSNGKVLPATGFGKRSKKASKDDPWETLFQQLEKDLENDPDDSVDREITEEDMENFERELDMVVDDISNAQTIGSDDELDNLLRARSNDGGEAGDDKDDYDDANNEEGNYDIDKYDDDDFSDDDEIEEPRLVNLEKWQLRKLAAAVELGRRKVNIKSLAAELKLDRDDVIFFLKSPPPELLLLASQMGDERKQLKDSDEEGNAGNDAEEGKDIVEPNSVIRTHEGLETRGEKTKEYGPRDWIKGKRTKKVHLATLQRVYRRTKWPTNAMVESLVRATNLPHRCVVEWFEEERAKSGIRDQSSQRAASRKVWKKPVTHTFARLEW